MVLTLMGRTKRFLAVLCAAVMISLMAGVAAFAGSQVISTAVTVGTALQITVDNNALNFGQAVAGATDVTNNTHTQSTATITSPSFGFNVLLEGTDLTGVTTTTEAIPVTGMGYTLDVGGVAAAPGYVSTTATIVSGNQPATAAGGQTYAFGFNLDIPALGVSEQNYAGSVTITASTI